MTVRVVFFVDFGPSAGAGHLSRASTLARAMQERGASYEIYGSDGALIAVSEPTCSDQKPGGGPSRADIVIVDGLRFTPGDIESRRAQSALFVVVDDLGSRPVECDILINPNIYGSRLLYAGYGFQQALLGPEWALIKPEFAAARSGRLRTSPRPLLSFGGGSTGAIAVDIAVRMAAIHRGPIDVAIGSLADVGGANLPENVQIHRDADMPSLMARATLFVGSLGVTFLEALAADLPTIAVCVVANQKLALDAARDLGVTAFERADAPSIAVAAIEALKYASPLHFEQPDGHGAARTADALLEALSVKRRKD